MNGKEFKSLVYHELANVGKAFADPVRLEILDMLAQAPKHVDQLSREGRMSVATTSHHLQLLKQSGLVAGKKSGRFVTYEPTELGRVLFQNLCAEAQHNVAEIQIAMQRFFDETYPEPVSEKEIIRKLQAGEIYLIDVRPTSEYAAGHVPGAVSLPLADLRKKLRTLPKKKPVFAYCRGRYCVLSEEATAFLREKGYNAFRVERGPLDFQARGIALSKSEDFSQVTYRGGRA